MGEILEKLTPDRDMQCYFERPSAVAAMSGASGTGFTVSGSWRQQFDWAVIEWNRDNTLDHPMFRPLPDGDLSGLVLSYEETRTNAMAMDCDLYPSVDWPYLRIWIEGETGDPHRVALKEHATPVEGSYEAATAEFELSSLPGVWEYIGLVWMSEHATYRITPDDTLETALDEVVASINAKEWMQAQRVGNRVRVISQSPGANGNRVGVYGFVTGDGAGWSPGSCVLSGGSSPTRWRVELDFGNLRDTAGNLIDSARIRKMRWTYAADFQRGAFARSEFSVQVSNWTVAGSGRAYSVAGPGSYRIEDDSAAVSYSGEWTEGRGNYSGGSIRYTTAAGAGLRCIYRAACDHRLYVGTRRAENAGSMEVVVDASTTKSQDLVIPGEDVLVRVPVGEFGPGEHIVEITNTGQEGACCYFDFLEVAIPAAEVAPVAGDSVLALATDWDTDHSISAAAERTAWMVHSLGFHGTANHYAGALWFYEMTRSGHAYASATVEFIGTPEFSELTTITIDGVAIEHRNLIGDTAATIAEAFELEINRGYMGVRAEASGTVLTIRARAMGGAGNAISIDAEPKSGGFVAQAGATQFEGGTDGEWRTDLASVPRMNRAARDWTYAYLAALAGYGIDAVVAFSLELQHADPSVEAGIAQRYPNGDAVVLNTPALQTNFSPASLAFWQRAYREMAELMQAAGMAPFVQFGEVQWWYFPLAGSGMPFYDAYTKDAFRAAYGREMAVVTDSNAAPSSFPDESAFLPGLIGAFTAEVMSYVKAAAPSCKFEVLYPPDVNEPAFNRAVNFPLTHWTPANLSDIKTESFTYTGNRNLDKAAESIAFPSAAGFPPEQQAHLVGIGEYASPWLKEVEIARAAGVKSVVLFALDQFCLIGHAAPVRRQGRRAAFLG